MSNGAVPSMKKDLASVNPTEVIGDDNNQTADSFMWCWTLVILSV